MLRTPWFGPLLTSVLPDTRCPSSKVCVPTTLTSESPALTGAVQHPPHFCICLSWMLSPEHLLSGRSTQLPAEIISTTHELQPWLVSCFSIKPTPIFLSSTPSLCKGWGLSNPAGGDFLWPTRRQDGDSQLSPGQPAASLALGPLNPSARISLLSIHQPLGVVMQGFKPKPRGIPLHAGCCRQRGFRANMGDDPLHLAFPSLQS